MFPPSGTRSSQYQKTVGPVKLALGRAAFVVGLAPVVVEDLAVEREGVRLRRPPAGALEAYRGGLAVRVRAERAAVLHVHQVRPFVDLHLPVHLAAGAV